MDNKNAFPPTKRGHEQLFASVINLPESEILQKLDQRAMDEFLPVFKVYTIGYGCMVVVVMAVVFIQSRNDLTFSIAGGV